jgi:hypothetical protein
MDELLSRPARRTGVIVNYLSATITATVFCLGEYGGWTGTLALICLGALISLAISVFVTLVKTGFWRLTHTSVEKLDEREIQITHTSLRYAYRIFGVLALVAIALLFLSMRFSLLTLTPGGYPSLALATYVATIYLNQTLPASIIAWNEPRI